jgi:hypothetical protein
VWALSLAEYTDERATAVAWAAAGMIDCMKAVERAGVLLIFTVVLAAAPS